MPRKSAAFVAMEDELSRLRDYKTLTKLRMKQAAEKLASYRIQLEECQSTIASLKQTIDSQQKTIQEQAQQIESLQKTREIPVAIAPEEQTEETKTLLHEEPTKETILEEPQLSLDSSSDDDDGDDSDSGSESSSSTSSSMSESFLDLDDEPKKTNEDAHVAPKTELNTEVSIEDAEVLPSKYETPQPIPVEQVTASKPLQLPADPVPTVQPTSPACLKRPLAELANAETKDASPVKKLKTNQSIELVQLQQTIQKPLAKHQRADTIIQAYFRAVRAIDEPSLQETCLVKTLNALVKHHKLPLAEIAPAFIKVGSTTAMDTAVYVEFLWQLASSSPSDLVAVLQHIASFLAKKGARSPKVQTTWCRVHTHLCRRANLVACSRTFLMDRLVEFNCSIWDAVAIGQTWPNVLSLLGDTTALLPTTIRFVLGSLYESESAKDDNLVYFDQLITLCQLQPLMSDATYVAHFHAKMNDEPFETCESLRLLLRTKGWAWCSAHLPTVIDNNTESNPSSLRLRIMGVTAAMYVNHGYNDATLVNHAKEMVTALIHALESEASDTTIKIAAAAALLEVAENVPTKALQKDYVAHILTWFQTQPVATQLCYPNGFLQRLHSVTALLA
ncbi:unnamed protein product [Aphanomyces euteiches]